MKTGKLCRGQISLNFNWVSDSRGQIRYVTYRSILQQQVHDYEYEYEYYISAEWAVGTGVF